MTAQLYIFPLDRRVGYVRQKAAKLLNQKGRAEADAYLDQIALPSASDSLKRIGFASEEIKQQLGALRTAITAESWRQVMTGGKASAESA